MRFRILTEGTKYDKKAAKVISDSGLFSEEISNNIIKALFEQDIHAFVHSPAWLEKYLVGIARMLVAEANGDTGRAQTFLSECPSIFDEYLTWIKEVRTEENKQKLDDEFINKMSYQDVKDVLAKRREELNQKSKEELANMEFGSSNYSLVLIKSFDEFNSKYGGHVTGDGSSDKYAGGGGTAWCHANSKSTYDSWIKKGKFVVLQNNDWKKISFNPESNRQNPKDAYGNSLIALLVSPEGDLLNATLRCNHVGVSSNADNQYETYAELSRIAGFNVEEEVLKNLPKINERTGHMKIVDGVLVKYFGNEKEVVIPNSVTKIWRYAFEGCAPLTSITIPNSVTEIGYGAFSDCTSLTSVTIPNSVAEIGQSAFEGCTALTSITISNSVTEIGKSAFFDCTALTSVTIPNSITEIREFAFRSCKSLTSITIPNSVTEIGGYAFAGCTSLTSVTIPDSVTKIGFGVFAGCTSFTSVTIPNSVTEIGNLAFLDCTSLTVYTDNEYVIKYCEKNEISYKPLIKTEGRNKMKFKLLNESINVPHNAKLCGELTDEELNILAQQIVEDCVEERRDGYYSVSIVTDQRDVDDWDEVECDVHLEGWVIRKGYGDNSELSDFEINRQEDKDGPYREIPNQVDIYFSVDGCDTYGNDYRTIEYPFTENIYDDMKISEFIEDSKKWISKEIDNFDFDEMDVVYRGYLDFGESLNEELIKPKKDEEKDDFIGRFMSDDLSKKEFPNNKQRFAVCMSIWGKAQKDK